MISFAHLLALFLAQNVTKMKNNYLKKVLIFMYLGIILRLLFYTKFKSVIEKICI